MTSIAFEPGMRVRFTGIKGIVDDRTYITGATFPADEWEPESVEIYGGCGLCGVADIDDIDLVP